MKKMFIGFLLGSVMLFTFGHVEAGVVQGSDGCDYWNGDRNYVAIAYSGIFVTYVQLDSCWWGDYHGTSVPCGQIVITPVDSSSQGGPNSPAYFFSNGSYQTWGGSTQRMNVRNVRAVVEKIYSAASQ